MTTDDGTIHVLYTGASATFDVNELSSINAADRYEPQESLTSDVRRVGMFTHVAHNSL